ncbi:MAG: hypothetical protein DPW11_01870 [bacterium]|nr:hypothetical protein [Candidatus Microgenomates bacterium CPR3]MCQ3944505.1 hypothetical protein [bacterium]
MYVKDKQIVRTVYSPIFEALKQENAVILTSDLLTTWDSYRRTDWIKELEYLELTYQETQKFLLEKYLSA